VRKSLPKGANGGVVFKRAQPRDRSGWLGSNSDYAKPESVEKLEDWVTVLEFLQQSKDAEIPLSHVGIVEQDNGSFGELRKPGFKIVPHGLIGMEAVNMQQVNTSVRESLKCLVERASEQFRERKIVPVMEGAKLAVDLLSILSRVLVA